MWPVAREFTGSIPPPDEPAQGFPSCPAKTETVPTTPDPNEQSDRVNGLPDDCPPDTPAADTSSSMHAGATDAGRNKNLLP